MGFLHYLTLKEVTDNFLHHSLKKEIKKAQRFANILYIYLSMPNLDAQIHFDDLMEIVKALVPCLNQNTPEKVIYKLIAEILVRQLLKRGANL